MISNRIQMKPQQTFLLIGLAFLIAVVACIYFIDHGKLPTDQKTPLTAKDTTTFQWEPTVEVDVPGTGKYPDPTFIVYLDSQGKVSYEIVGKQEATAISFDQLRGLLQQHQEEEPDVALEVWPDKGIDYSILRKYMTEIGTMGVKNYRLAGIGEEE